MGAWGHHFDENDDAADWLGDFGDQPDWSIVRATLSDGAKLDDYIESDLGAAGLAAAEIVAAAIGKPSPRLSPEITTWANENPAEANDLTPLAREAVTNIRDSGELQELWREADASEWLATVNDLIFRLS